jgi:hypothetical protein
MAWSIAPAAEGIEPAARQDDVGGREEKGGRESGVAEGGAAVESVARTIECWGYAPGGA